MPRVGCQPQPVRGGLSKPLHCRNPTRTPATALLGLRNDRGRRQRGIALVLVLWLTVLLTVIAGSFAYGMRTEALAARNTVSLAKARALADGAVNRTIFELMRPRLTPDVWSADGSVHAWDEEGARIAVSAVDESGKIDLNAASDPLLKALLQTAGGIDSDTADRLVDVIGDWKDADDLRRPNGAEAPDYQAAGLPYKPANAPFEAVAELQRVLGMTPELYAKLADSLTVHTRIAGFNPAYASRTVLLALPGATPEIVDTYLAQRRDALAAKLPPPPFPLGGGIVAALNIWRIRAEVALPDGALFVREAVIRPGAERRRLLIVLEWREGDRRILADPAAPEGDEKARGKST
jgi:general secretion pathway protein K